MQAIRDLKRQGFEIVAYGDGAEFWTRAQRSNSFRGGWRSFSRRDRRVGRSASDEACAYCKKAACSVWAKIAISKWMFVWLRQAIAILIKWAQQSSFRADLFHRLNVLSIKVPPLRERADDLAPLTEHFLERFPQPEKACL